MPTQVTKGRTERVHTQTQLVNTISRGVCEDVIGDSIDKEGGSSRMRVSVITGS